MIIGAIVLITILLLLAKERISPFSIVSDVVMIMTVFCAFLIAGTLLTSGLLHFGLDSQRLSVETKYEELVFRVEAAGNYTSDPAALDTLLSEVGTWNSDISWKKQMQRNRWIGVFIPNIYDNVESIPYEARFLNGEMEDL